MREISVVVAIAFVAVLAYWHLGWLAVGLLALWIVFAFSRGVQ